MALLTTALALAEVVPSVLKLFGKDEDAEVAGKVLGIAKTVTGKETDSEALDALKADPDLVLQYKQAILDDKWVQERIDLANVQGAREMHKVNNKQADELGKSIINWNLPLALVLFAGNLGALHFFKDHAEILITVGNLTGFLLNSLIKERQDVINFYFGSSLGSKIKSYTGGKS